MYMAFADSFSKVLGTKFEPYKLLSGGLLSSLVGKYFGSNLTGAEREANAFTEQQNQEAMAFEERMADKQMAFQEEQASTQWQRGVSDMLSAGLNPALAYGQGGASAMQGVTARGSAGSSVSPNAIGLSDLIQLATLKPQIKLMEAQTRDINAGASLKETDAGTRGALNEAELSERLQNVQNLKSSKLLMDWQRISLGPAEIVLKRAEADAAKSQSHKLDAESVFIDWQNEFYHRFGYWPRENTQSFIWQVINGMIGASGYDGNSSYDFPPPPGYTSIPFNVKKD